MPLGNATTIKLIKKLRYYDSGKKNAKEIKHNVAGTMHIPWRTIVTTSRLCYENWDTNCLKNFVNSQATRDKVASPSLKRILYHELPPVETLSLVIRKSI